MRTVIIGGTGHIGTYLAPRLVRAGHQVTVISRGGREAYSPDAAWDAVRMVTVQREKAEADHQFGTLVRSLDAEIVIDLICFTVESARELVAALRDHTRHFLHCGTIWKHGPATEVPLREEAHTVPFGEYGIRKAAIEGYLLNEARQHGFPATIIDPGHITGPGWRMINPQGNLNPVVFEKLARGDELLLPNFGLETLHHVHADDVAQAFECAINHWSVSAGEAFHAVSPAALTLRGYAQEIAHWFGQKPNLRFVPWDEWRTSVSHEDAEATYDHIAHSPSASIAKAQRLIEYQPRYSSMQAILEGLQWLIEHGEVRLPSMSR
ncbi:MAG TPA: NAD-dependent epimerase/dehydratase family protein [Levilinea sp.]|nr:NAD-dependent epimerase/dehydratase family protein [Levilinea sp.]